MYISSGTLRERLRGPLGLGGLVGVVAWVLLGTLPAAIATLLGIGVTIAFGPLVGVLTLVLGLHAVGIELSLVPGIVTGTILVSILISLPRHTQTDSTAATTIGVAVFLGVILVVATAAGLTPIEQTGVVGTAAAGCSYLLHRVELVQLGLTDVSEGDAS